MELESTHNILRILYDSFLPVVLSFVYPSFQISLDMEKAFDSVSREIVYRAFDLISLPYDLDLADPS